MSQVREIVAGKFRLQYVAVERGRRGSHQGFPTHQVWLEAQCIIEFEGDTQKPPPMTFFIKTREVKPFEFNPDFKVNLFTGKGGEVQENMRHHVLALIWAHLHGGIPLLPIPTIDLNQVELVG